MFESNIGDTIAEPAEEEPVKKKNAHWFLSFIKIFKRYKTELFGAGDSEIKTQRMLDYTVKPSNRFVLAKFTDGTFRPACLAGRNKKKQTFIVSFYHVKKCVYVKPCDVIFRHGNLLNLKVSFMSHGVPVSGRVFGNNSPANKGFPTIFFVRIKQKWHKVPFKSIFLTSKQVSSIAFEIPAFANKKKETRKPEEDVEMDRQFRLTEDIPEVASLTSCVGDMDCDVEMTQ